MLSYPAETRERGTGQARLKVRTITGYIGARAWNRCLDTLLEFLR